MPASPGLPCPQGHLLPTAAVSPEGIILAADDAVARLLGRPATQVQGQPLVTCCVAADRPAIEGMLEAAKSGQACGEISLRLRTAAGDQRTVVLVWSETRHGGEAGWLRTVWIGHPSPQLEADTLLEAALRARFEWSQVPQTVVDPDARYLAVNDAFCSLVGVSREQLLGRRMSEFSHPREACDSDEVVTRLLAGEVVTAQVERTLRGADARPIPVLGDLTVVRDEQGQPRAVASFAQDLTSLRAAERRQQRQEEFFLALSQRASELALVTDPEGGILYASPALQQLFGFDITAVLGETIWHFVHPADAADAEAAYRLTAARGGTGTSTIRLRDGRGASRVAEVTVTNLLDTAVGGLVCNVRDVTDQVTAEQALRASEARFRAIADTAAEGIWAADRQGKTFYANGRMAEIMGISLETLYAVPVFDLLAEGEAAAMRQRVAERQQLGVARYEVRHTPPGSAQERVLAVASSPLTIAGGAGFDGSLATVSDVTESRRLEEQLRHAALHDPLTGLPNRALLLDRLEHAVARQNGDTAVLLLDLDQFKLVNDAGGHGVGDELLRAVGDRLCAAARPGDTVARFGGDEFVVVREQTDEAEAVEVAHELLAALASPFELGGTPVHVGASVGVAVSPGATAGDLLRYADTAMYSAKAAGRGQVRLFDQLLAEIAEQTYTLAADLRRALETDQLEVHYQPIVDMDTGRIVSMEALTRWAHPDHGMIPPPRFVAVAEQTGQAGALDGWVLRRALADLARFKAAGVVPPDVSVSVNVSARNLAMAGLDEMVLSATTATGLLPREVTLEITEGAVMQDPSTAIGLLRRLRDHGFGIAIDDFGTGYSSLAYLRDLPITSLKIDRSFVSGIAENGDALAIATSIIDLARAVGVTTVAEGVETNDQAAVLRRLGCEAGQGWLWSRATPAAEVLASGDWNGPMALPAPAPTPTDAKVGGSRVGPEHGVDRLRELDAQGASASSIAAALNREGFRAPSGTRWHRTSVAAVLIQPDPAGGAKRAP